MPLWPFKRRRHSTSRETDQPLSEKQQSTGVSSPPIIAAARRASLVSKDHEKRDSQPPVSPIASLEKEGKQFDTEWVEKGSLPEGNAGDLEKMDVDKENRPISRTWQSREDITALPMSEPLENSPHLRPVDLEKPAIPYNFRTLTGSQTSFQRQDSVKKTSRPGTLRSKRSTADYSIPQRKRSSKIKTDPLREEEIRAMSAAVDIPKYAGDTPLRRESKRTRGIIGLRDSTVSLPPEGSIHSSMSGLLEQRGWEVGALAIFNPRPNIRVAELPQYVSPISGPPSSAGVLYRIDSIRAKDKRPVTRESIKTGKSGKSGKRQRERIGDKADSLASSDLRAIMERETKRKELKQKERQEKIDRKLRSRPTRDRKDSERRRIAESRARADAELRSLAPLTPPTDVHPAFRTKSNQSETGSGFGLLPPSPQAIENIIPQTIRTVSEQPDPDPEPVSPIDESNPFADPRPSYGQDPEVSPIEDTFPETPGADETVVVDIARAIHMRTTNTPPLSPVATRIIRQPSKASLPPTPTTPIERKKSEAPSERKFPFTTFFRRGGTNPRVKETKADSTSFSNASRESVKAHALPTHLIEADGRRPSASRSISGSPHPTHSRFREELPETPTSPPAPMAQSAEVGAAATGTLAGAAKPEPIDIKGAVSTSVSPSASANHGHMMSASMASVDSEGSWLASGSQKRRSTQSALSRSFSKRNTDFTASYEDLGSGAGDKDAEYFLRGALRPRLGGSLAGATPDEEMELNADDDATPLANPMTIHDSAGRQPLVVHRNSPFISREVLVLEHSPNESSAVLAPPEHEPYPESTSASEYFDAEDEQHSDLENPSTEEESPSPGEEPELQSATSVRYASRHSRQFSAGSARLLDVAPRRVSLDAINADLVETPRPMRPSSSPRPFERSGTL